MGVIPIQITTLLEYVHDKFRTKEKGERCKAVPLGMRLRQGVHFHNFVVLVLLARTFRQENERKCFQTRKEGAKLSGENMII